MTDAAAPPERRRSPWPARLLAWVVGMLLWTLPYGFDELGLRLKGFALLGVPALAYVVALVVWRRVRRPVPWIALTFGALTPPALIMAWVMLMILEPHLTLRSHARPFDAATWLADDHHDFDPDDRCTERQHMLDDLLDSERLLGLERDALLELLGPPAPEGFPFGATTCDVHWHVGPERGLFALDSEWLFVAFGDDGRVERVWLYTD